VLLLSSSSSSVSWTKPFSRHLDIWNIGHVFNVAQVFDKGVLTVKFTSNLSDAILGRVRIISEHVLVELKQGPQKIQWQPFLYYQFDAMSRARGFFPVALASMFGVATGMSHAYAETSYLH